MPRQPVSLVLLALLAACSSGADDEVDTSDPTDTDTTDTADTTDTTDTADTTDTTDTDTADTDTAGTDTADTGSSVPSIAWVVLEPGPQSTCGIDVDGALWCWGSTQYGQAPLGAEVGTVSVPTRVGSDTDWADVRLALTHGCGLKADGALYCWGWGWDADESGTWDLGDTRWSPVPLDEARRYRSLTVASDTTCGVDTGGTLRCWGKEAAGNALLGTGAAGSVVAVGTARDGGTSWEAVQCTTTGGNRCLARQTDGSLWSWGRDAETNGTDRPLSRVGTGSGWVTFATAWETSVATDDQSRLHVWGLNDASLLLQESSTTVTAEPTRKAAAHTATRYDIVPGLVCGLLSSGELACAGLAEMLGTGETEDRWDFFLRISVAGPFVDFRLEAGGGCVVRDTGEGYCWGTNAGSRLDPAGVSTAPTPVAIAP